MKTFVHTLVIIATLALGNVAPADEKAHVITGRVVDVSSVSINVQSGKKRPGDKHSGYQGRGAESGRYSNRYTSGHHHYRADPENIASKIEVKAPGGSKKQSAGRGSGVRSLSSQSVRDHFILGPKVQASNSRSPRIVMR
jgi:hypothetical protein